MRYMAIVRRPKGDPQGDWSVENIDAKELASSITMGSVPVDGAIPEVSALRWMAAGINWEEKAFRNLHQYYKDHPRIFKLSKWYAYWVAEVFKSR